MELRQANAADRAACAHVLHRAFTGYVRGLGRDLPETPFGALETALGEGRVTVACRDGRIVGVAVVSELPDGRMLDQLAVAPEEQRGGIGRALLAEVERIARRDGCAALELLTAEMFTHLVAFYRRAGFGIVGRGLPDHGRDTHIRVRMRKTLAAAAAP